MPFGFRWPYTDFHRLNADWILRTMRELKERIEQALAGVTEYGDRLDAAETDIDGLVAAVATNTHDIQSAGAHITGLEGRMDAAEADIDGVEHDVEGMRSTIAGLQLTTAQHTQQIAALDGRMSAAEADIDAQGERLDAVEELAASSPYIVILSYSNGAYALSESVTDIVGVLAQGERPVIINAQGVGEYPGNPQPRISEVQISDLKTALIGGADSVEGTVTLTIGTAQELKMIVSAGAQEPDAVNVVFQTVPIGGGAPTVMFIDKAAGGTTWRSDNTFAELLAQFQSGGPVYYRYNDYYYQVSNSFNYGSTLGRLECVYVASNKLHCVTLNSNGNLNETEYTLTA